MSFDPDKYLEGNTAVETPPAAESFDPDKFLGEASVPKVDLTARPLLERAAEQSAARPTPVEFSPDKYLEEPTAPKPKPTSGVLNDMARRMERGIFRAMGYLQAAAQGKNARPDFYGKKNMGEYIPTMIDPHIDRARDDELKSTIAEGAGTAVPALGATLMNPVLGPVVLAGQMGEEQRALSLAAGDTEEIANEKAKIGRLGGAVMGLLPVAKSRAGAGLVEGVMTKVATGGLINAGQDAAMQAATGEEIDWERVEQSGKIGMGMGALFAVPNAARSVRDAGRAATLRAADAFDGSIRGPEGNAALNPVVARAVRPSTAAEVPSPRKSVEESARVFSGEQPAEFSPEATAYREQPAARGGRYISADVARPLVPGFDPLNPTATNAQASTIAEAAFQAGLKDANVKEVTLLAGGAGSGKSAAQQFTDGPNEMVYDGVFGSQNSLARLDQVVASGKPARVVFVYRPLNDALTGMFSRRGGSTPVVPAEVATRGHYQSAENFIAAAKRYQGNPNVAFEVIDNSGPKGSAAPVENPVGFLEQVTKNRPSYEQALTEARNHPALSGLSEAERGAYLGRALAPESTPGGGQPQPVGLGVGETRPIETTTPTRELATPVSDAVASSGSAVVLRQAGGQAEPILTAPKKGATLKVGNAPDGTPDLLTAIEDLGGAPGPSKARGKTPEYDGYNEAFARGPARLLRRKGGVGIDTFITQLEAAGFKFDSLNDFYAAVGKASEQRVKLAKQLGDVEYGAKFDAALIENAGRKAHLDPVDPIPVDELNVGDQFKVRGEPVRVTEIDPDTNAVKIQDGVKRELPPGTPIYPDANSLKRTAAAADFIPDNAAGRIDPTVMAALGRSTVGGAIGYYSGDTPEEKARNAAIGATAGLFGPRLLRPLVGKKGTAPGQPVSNGAALATPPPPSAKIIPGPGVPPSQGSKPLGLVASAKASPEIVPELRASLAGFYEPQTNAATYAEARARIDAAPDLQSVKASLLVEKNPTAVSQATGLELIRKFQAEGKLQDAADVLYDMSVKAKTQGQAIQILSTLSRDTPEGVAAFAQRLFGRKLTAEELAQINVAMARVNAAKAPEVKLARQAMLLDELARKSGHGAKWDDKATGAMNIAMLLNPKTIIRNIGGNVVMASADLTADMISPVVDAGVSVFTGRRTVSGPQMMEYARGLGTPARDFKAGFDQARSEGATRLASFREGLDTMAVMAKLVSTSKTEVGDIARAYRSTFSSPLMRALEKTMNVVMGGPDRAFYSGRLRSSLASQMKAEGTTVPTAAMIDQASLEAARAVYQDANFVSTALRDVRSTLNRVSTFGKSSRFGAGQAIVPFVQVPGSLLMRGLEYSPAGFLKAAAESVGPLLPGKRPFNQREFSQAFSKALVGSGLIAGTGYMLAKLGIVSGTPETDPKVRAVTRSLGFGGYTVNVSAFKRAFQSMDWKTPQPHDAGDVHVSYDWAQPMAFPAAVGASLAESEQRAKLAGERGKVVEAPSRVLTALMSGARTLEEQPLLTGLTGFMTSAANANREGAGMIEALATSMATLPGQYVPTASRQVQQLMDNRVYETRGTDKLETAWQSAAANIPGLAAELGFKPRSGLLGDMAERYQANGNSFFNVIVNPAFVTKVKSDPELREIYRLWEQTGQTSQIPGQVDAKLTINGKPKILTSPERADMQQFVGRVTRDAYKQLMRSEGYANASDEQRAKVLAQVVSSANTVARVQLFGDRPRTMDKWDRALLGLSPAVLEKMKTATPSK